MNINEIHTELSPVWTKGFTTTLLVTLLVSGLVEVESVCFSSVLENGCSVVEGAGLSEVIGLVASSLEVESSAESEGSTGVGGVDGVSVLVDSCGSMVVEVVGSVVEIVAGSVVVTVADSVSTDTVGASTSVGDPCRNSYTY